MNNLQKMINSTNNQLKKQESLVKSKLEELEHYIDLIANNNNNSNYLINQKEFNDKVFKNLNDTNSTLYMLKNSLIKEKNSNIYTNDVKSAISCIANIKNSIKFTQNKLIKAQNICALKGNIESADVLAKISLELNFQNHMFVKNASTEVVSLKQLVQNN